MLGSIAQIHKHPDLRNIDLKNAEGNVDGLPKKRTKTAGQKQRDAHKQSGLLGKKDLMM